jgi:hypothetical protein
MVLGWSSPSTRWRPVRAYGVRGGGAQLCFHVRAGSYDTDSLIGALQGLRRFLGGEKATLRWDGLPSHRSTAMRRWLNTQRHGWWSGGCPPTRLS